MLGKENSIPLSAPPKQELESHIKDGEGATAENYKRLALERESTWSATFSRQGNSVGQHTRWDTASSETGNTHYSNEVMG